MTIFNCFILSSVALFPGVEGTQNRSLEIDRFLKRVHQEQRVEPSSIVDDLVFLRRVSLDLIGRIPTLTEVKAFQANPDRDALVDALVDSPEFNAFISEAWTTWLIGYIDVYETDRETFRLWLWDQLENDVSFQAIVTNILTAEGSVAINGPTNFLARHFEDPLTAVCRSFLGVRLECAQCHDHPFDRWTQDDYQAMKRFFEPMQLRSNNGVVTISEDRRGTDESPRFLTGSKPRTERYRQELALYLTNCRPFARNFANRCWYFLMGKGIVDPPDDFNHENQAMDAKLLEYLAQTAHETEFSMKTMFRIICKTAAYQRTVIDGREQDGSLRYFAARSVKPLLPMQFVNSVAIGLNQDHSKVQRQTMIRKIVGSGNLHEDFQRTWEYRESIQQMLNVMTIGMGHRNRVLPSLALDETYMRLLTRRPTQGERVLCREFTQSDVNFALILSNEFCFNH